jgi:hypothetical protein
MRRLLALAVMAGLSALGTPGCGSKFPLPTENRAGRGYSTDNSYQMVATWKLGVAHVPLPPALGGQWPGK